ncbi:hypothetical protein LCGC14_2695030, partial [marine sediment metagenome]
MSRADETSGVKPRRRWPWIVSGVGLLLTAFLTWNYWPIEGHITIGYDTTRITGPVNPDGTVNYVAYLNEKYGKGVTPENNAVVLLIKAYGSEGMVPDDLREEFLKALGLAEMPQADKCFEDIPDDELEKLVEAARARGDTDVEEYDYLDRFRRWPWSAKEHPRIAQWLKENEEALAVVIEATRRPQYYYPVVTPAGESDMLSTLVPTIGP